MSSAMTTLLLVNGEIRRAKGASEFQGLIHLAHLPMQEMTWISCGFGKAQRKKIGTFLQFQHTHDTRKWWSLFFQIQEGNLEPIISGKKKIELISSHICMSTLVVSVKN